MELDGEARWTELAEKNWRKPLSQPRKVRKEIVKNEIWDVLEKEAFEGRSLVLLENLQLLEQYLWPGYSADASNYHVLLIALMVTVKRREGLSVWNIFNSNAENFSTLFRRILSMSVDQSLSVVLQNHILAFLIGAFQSLDSGIVRKECAPLVSISIWHHLVSEQAREIRFEEHAQLRKSWRAAARRFDAADEEVRGRLLFERDWLFSMIVKFVNYLYSVNDIDQISINYCERFIEFLSDLESQLPTRRYVNAVLQDLNILSIIKLSPLYDQEPNGLLRDLYSLLKHFVTFSVDDQTGAQYSRDKAYELHCVRLAKLQRIALKHHKDKLTLLALSNYGAIDQRPDLEGHLKLLSDTELDSLTSTLGYRTAYPDFSHITVDRALVLEILLSAHERRKTFQESVRDMNIAPTELDLYEPSLLRSETYNGSRSLAIPKLNLQYLSVGDFLWRSFVLYRCEAFFEIRKDIEDTIRRMQPRLAVSGGSAQFDGFSRMAIPITKPGILEVAPARVGSDIPAFVRAEVVLDVSKLADNVRYEWETLRPDDMVYLLAVKPGDRDATMTNGHSEHAHMKKSDLQHVRTAEVVQILDESGRPLRERATGQANGYGHKPRLRRLIVNIDSLAYAADEETNTKNKVGVYDLINVVVRRRGRENNFKRILESIKSLTLSDVPVPAWFQDVFLGYGDPTGATFQNLANRIAAIDFRDTFLDWQHLVESLPGKTIEPEESQRQSFAPPYVLETIHADIPAAASRLSKKRRRDEPESSQPVSHAIKVSTYAPPNNGPYISDALKKNQTRFTPAQVEAIISGTQPGLTIIVGPPGTGKTDVATQIISNIYHDFPAQRTLMIAHSNQALNQLFQKITKLDIDDRHLLRLGHGEEDLETNVNYGKHGRVESFLDNRGRLLAEVDRLAANLNAPGAHGNSCETAGYFKLVYVDPAWSKYRDAIAAPASDTEVIESAFPFHQYFSNAPQPLFSAGATRNQLLRIVEGCQRHIDKIFMELEDIRPFEILRNSRDRANYLLIKEARIIAMTSTHAAMRRQEIADLGFHYDNVIMEEAAQITEIETFIPFALQYPKEGKLPLQRIVLCGDHLQNSPIVQNLAFRQFANLEQSLFLRLVRLGVPVINLDQQGRARSSIAELYKWRYQNLGDLPNVLTGPEYMQANAGFRYDYQFIDVPDYKDAGEMQPSPHFIQNLGEAEYAIAIYQYMRLLGYPAQSISILTTYAGQRALIRDVLNYRCAKNRLFGLPRFVTTVDKYQGEQNDYVILSLVRTNRVGYLRDIRRLTVALSRARFGLYILGRQAVFESCYELREAFARLLKRPTTLMVVPGEMMPTTRNVDDEVEAVEMTGVEHLGQYVYEMTQAKIKQVNGVVPVMQAPDTELAVTEEVKDEDDDEPPQVEELDE